MSEHNITVEGGTSVRLKTAGKYCDRDIVVTAEGGSGVVNINEAERPTKADLGSFTQLGPVRFTKATEIAYQAFDHCEALTSVSFPLLEHMQNAEGFILCTNLISVDFPMAKNVDDYTFTSCTALTNVNIPFAEYIGAGAFNSCSALTSAVLPAVKEIEAGAFNGCSALTSAVLPAVISIGSEAFIDCTSLTSIDLPAATSIESGAFMGCTNFASLILRTTETVCTIDLAAVLGTKIMTTEGIPTGEGFVYIPASMDSAYRAAYEPVFEQLGAPELYDILFRKLEDYTVDGTATGALDESKI